MGIHISSGETSDISGQLVLLREMSKNGVVHQAQMLQLKYWPRILFPHSVHSQVSVDPDTFTVRIDVKSRGGAPAGQEERTQTLGKGIQWLLGSNWEVQIHEDNRRLLVLNRHSDTVIGRQEDSNPKYAGTDYEAGRYIPEVPWQPKKRKPL